MLMLVELLAPGMEHGEAADLGPEMRGVPGDVLERLRDGAKEQPIEQARVLQRQRPEVVRQGKDHMTVGDSEEFLLSGGEPRHLGRPMTCGAAAVPARVVRLHFVPTVVALGNVASQGGRATQRDGAQGPMLRAREGVAIAGQKSRAMLAHHIGHFKLRPIHGSVSRSAGKARASRGLSVACTALAATCK